MDWRIELGRAVLSPPGTNLELWLTTLINILPKQHATNIQHQNDASLIELLSSGEVWVERGLGMHVLLDITWCGQPIENAELRWLAEGIIHAPAWKQLNLQPSLPFNSQSHPGRLQINIAQLRSDGDKDSKKSHRICGNVPAADARPPEGIPVFALQSVHFSLVMSENRAKTASMRQRQEKRQSAGNDTQSTAAAGAKHSVSLPNELLYEPAEFRHSSDDEDLFTSLELQPLVQNQKRKRPASPSRRFQDGLKTAANQLSHYQRRGSNTFFVFGLPVARTETTDASRPQLIQNMVDAVVRLSVSNNLRGSTGGWKINANSFTGGLADIAPALWRPGYIAAITQRAHLVPTISTSLNRFSSQKSSATLRDKVTGLVYFRYQETECTPNNNSIASTTANRIWIYAQKHLLSRPAPSLIQSFCLFSEQNWAVSEDDDADLLDEINNRFHGHVASFATKDTTREQICAEVQSRPARTDDDEAVQTCFSRKHELHGLLTRATPLSCHEHSMDPLTESSQHFADPWLFNNEREVENDIYGQ